MDATNRPTPGQISAAAAQLAFGQKIILNNLRALVVEVIVHCALKPYWRHCSEDWKGWDLEHQDGTHLEVKQSALQQTWTASQTKSLPRFDIRERTGYWENGNRWVGQIGRYAQIYVFAYIRLAERLQTGGIRSNGSSTWSGQRASHLPGR